MKTLFQFFINLLLFIVWVIVHFIFFLWYGKLPKVSPYHHYNEEFKVTETFLDNYVQTKKFPIPLTEKDKLKVIDELFKNEKCKKYLLQGVPLFNDLGEEHGTQSLCSLLEDEIRKNS